MNDSCNGGCFNPQPFIDEEQTKMLNSKGFGTHMADGTIHWHITANKYCLKPTTVTQ